MELFFKQCRMTFVENGRYEDTGQEKERGCITQSLMREPVDCIYIYRRRYIFTCNNDIL